MLTIQGNKQPYCNGKVSMWGKNLTDEHQLNYVAPFGLYIPGQYIPPLTFGADITVQF